MLLCKQCSDKSWYVSKLRLWDWACISPAAAERMERMEREGEGEEEGKGEGQSIDLLRGRRGGVYILNEGW